MGFFNKPFKPVTHRLEPIDPELKSICDDTVERPDMYRISHGVVIHKQNSLLVLSAITLTGWYDSIGAFHWPNSAEHRLIAETLAFFRGYERGRRDNPAPTTATPPTGFGSGKPSGEVPPESPSPFVADLAANIMAHPDEWNTVFETAIQSVRDLNLRIDPNDFFGQDRDLVLRAYSWIEAHECKVRLGGMEQRFRALQSLPNQALKDAVKAHRRLFGWPDRNGHSHRTREEMRAANRALRNFTA